MKKLVCEMCGGSDLVKQDGVFVCQNCGTKYSVEEARKMMVEGTVSVEGTVAVEGTVKVDKSEELKRLYTLAHRAKESDNTDNAVRYYTQIEMQDPDSWEAYFYLIYFKARVSKVGEINKDCKNLSNSYKTTIQLILNAYSDATQVQDAIRQVLSDILVFSDIICSTAKHVYKSFDDSLERRKLFISALELLENLGDDVLANTQYPVLAAEIWKAAIKDVFIKDICSGSYSNSTYNFITKASGTGYEVKSNYILNNLAKKIYEIDPTYEDPFGVAKKLRKNETFITCPKCGTKMRERESKCPKCGASKEEIQRLIKEKEEREAAERERIRKENEAKEAEEARIRAEQRAEWWAANKKKVIITTIVIIGIIVAIIGIKKAVVVIAEKKAVTEAYELIEKGNQLIDTYHFDEAKELFDSALKMTADKGVQDKVSWSTKKMFTARQAANIEYDKALKRLKILLDADDNEFNQYSNECLDKMIEIYPNKPQTIYYTRIRNNPNDQKLLESQRVDGQTSATLNDALPSQDEIKNEILLLLSNLSKSGSKSGNQSNLSSFFTEEVSPYVKEGTSRKSNEIPDATKQFLDKYDYYEVSAPNSLEIEKTKGGYVAVYTVIVEWYSWRTRRKKACIQKTTYINNEYKITGFIDKELWRKNAENY